MRKTFKIASATITILLFNGCASTPVANVDATPVPAKRIDDQSFLQPGPEKVALTIKRDGGLYVALCSYQVYIDGKPVADINPAEKVECFVSPGSHIISAKPNGVCPGALVETEAHLIQGEPATYRIGWGQQGDIFITKTAF